MVFMASFSGLQQRNEKSFSKRVQLQFYTTSYYFGEYKVTTFLSLTINIFVIKLTRKWKKNHFCFSNPKLPPLKVALSRAKSKLSVRLDKLGKLAGTSQNAYWILIFSFATSVTLLKKISVTWNHISLSTLLYWSVK